MRDAVIVDAVRTPIGKRNGALAGIHPADLTAHVLQALAARTGLDPVEVDDVIWGCVTQVGDQSGNLGRVGALAAGWPDSVPGTTVDRRCGSAQQAISFAAATVISGQYDIAVAGGVESMSRSPMGSNVGEGMAYSPSVLERYGVERFNQGIGAEMIAEKWNLSRTDLDAYSARSHDWTAAAADAGAFDSQLAPIAGLTQDEGLRRGSSVESLAVLRTAFREDGVVTAGNSSQISDGASALLVTTSEIARAHGWSPLARIHTAVVVGDDPVMMLVGVIPATAKALQRSGLTIDEIGAFEVNEAFASVPRVRTDVREKALNALRQLVDEVDSGRFPGLYLLITGTPAFFDGTQGMQRLPPLAQRLATDFTTDARFDNPRAVQIRLAGFSQDLLRDVGSTVRDLYACGSESAERVRTLVDDEYIASLASAVAGSLGGQVGVAPRVFLKKLVGDVLDRVDQFEDFDPRRDYRLTVSSGELNDVERNAAAGTNNVDDIEL